MYSSGQKKHYVSFSYNDSFTIAYGFKNQSQNEVNTKPIIDTFFC